MEEQLSFDLGDNGNGHKPTIAEVRSLIGEIRALETTGVLLNRRNWFRNHGMSFEGRRDEYAVLGYPDSITVGDYRDAYERGGIAGSIIDVMPDATWRGDPPMKLVEDDDPENTTEFEKAWTALDQKHQICGMLLRVDKLSRLSEYAVLLIGAAGDGDLSQELPRSKNQGDGLLYLAPFLGGGGPGSRPFSGASAYEADATVQEYETNTRSPRFGKPKTYSIKSTVVGTTQLNGQSVHWSRVIHVAEGLLDNEVFGQPALQRVWNLLMDLRKVTGGGSESFWLRANQGLHVDIDKDLAMSDVDGTVAMLKEQAEAYKHQLTRWLRTRGVNVQTLGSDVANFSPNADAIITQIAGAKRIPKRILTGAEMGELASTQDRENFRDQIIGRQMQYAGPYIVRQLADRLIEYRYLPTPKKETGYQVWWPHIQVMTEAERVEGAKGWATVNASQGETVYTDSEIREKWSDMKPLTDEQRKEIEDRKKEEQLKQQDIDVTGAKKMAKAVPPEIKAAMSGSHKFSSTQVQLPPTLADALFALGKGIPAFDLCDEEGGLENDAHITIKYGIHTNDVADVRKTLATYVGPIRFTLGRTAIFESPEYDVLYVEVFSPDLRELNQRISNSLEVTDTHPVYIPHATVAYLKSGLGRRYVGMNTLDGMTATVGFVRFSPAEGDYTDLRITGRDVNRGTFAVAAESTTSEAKEDEELIAVLAHAIEHGDEDVVRRICGLG